MVKDKLHKFSKSQLIQFIELYNLATHITGYTKMKKQQLIDAINSKFTINDNGEIQIRPDLKISVKKSTKVIKQQKKKLEDLSESELVKLLGSLRGDKDKLEEDVKELTEDIRVEEEDQDEPNEEVIKNNKKDIENIKPQIKALKEEINKVIDLIKAVRTRDEPKEKKLKQKDNDIKKLLSSMTKKQQESIKNKVDSILKKDKEEQQRHNKEQEKVNEQLKKLEEQFKKKPKEAIKNKVKDLLKKDKEEQERHNKEQEKVNEQLKKLEEQFKELKTPKELLQKKEPTKNEEEQIQLNTEQKKIYNYFVNLLKNKIINKETFIIPKEELKKLIRKDLKTFEITMVNDMAKNIDYPQGLYNLIDMVIPNIKDYYETFYEDFYLPLTVAESRDKRRLKNESIYYDFINNGITETFGEMEEDFEKYQDFLEEDDIEQQKYEYGSILALLKKEKEFIKEQKRLEKMNE